MGKTINAKHIPPANLSLTEWAWLAGILEGEGCFAITGGYPRITLKMTDEDIVNRVAQFFEASVWHRKRPDPKHKDIYHTQVGKTKLLHYIISNIWSYLGQRRREAILKWYDLWETKGYNFERPKY